MNEIKGLTDAIIPTIRYIYQFKIRIGSHNFASIRPIANPASPFNLKSINEN
jgi:hypothetical protein